MVSIESCGCTASECGLKPKSSVRFFANDGEHIDIPCALSPEDFIKIWNRSLFVVKLPVGCDHYAYIKKRRMAGFVTYGWGEKK